MTNKSAVPNPSHCRIIFLLNLEKSSIGGGQKKINERLEFRENWRCGIDVITGGTK
jgi:hypothetical protein